MILIPWDQVRNLPVGSKIVLQLTDTETPAWLSPNIRHFIENGAVCSITGINNHGSFRSMTVEANDRSTQILYSWDRDSDLDRAFLNTVNVYTVDNNELSNYNRSNCWKCGCKTEKRRDFNTFEIRDMCPRCRI